MSQGQKQSKNHPKKGSSIKVEPIRDLKAIKRIKKILADNPRDFCLFTLGINTAYRANEILSLKVRDVQYLNIGDVLDVKQSKVKEYRKVTLNRNVIEAITTLLASRLYEPDDFLFYSQRANVLTVESVNHLLKQWCKNVGLKDNYGSHSLRKTWGYHQRIQKNAPIPLLMQAYGHSTQKQTLDYLGIQDHEIKALYDLEL